MAGKEWRTHSRRRCTFWIICTERSDFFFCSHFTIGLKSDRGSLHTYTGSDARLFTLVLSATTPHHLSFVRINRRVNATSRKVACVSKRRPFFVCCVGVLRCKNAGERINSSGTNKCVSFLGIATSVHEVLWGNGNFAPTREFMAFFLFHFSRIVHYSVFRDICEL